MSQKIFIKRYSKLDRVFHLFIILTFMNQTITGFSRMFITTAWGAKLTRLLGGYETSFFLHKWGGILMIAGFLIHILYLLTKIDRHNIMGSLFGPDSLVPNLKDIQNLIQRVRCFLGFGSLPKMDRWAYWEKFGYWGVFWGMPLLGVTGVMLIDPVLTCRIMPGWALNITSLLHRAEAILAIAYLFIIHLFFGHFIPSKFPLNEAMFSGSVELEELVEERPAWVERLKKEGELELATTEPPALWYRILYFVFGYTALACGFYLLIYGIYYSRYIKLH
jgi:cytochrome b subunit of formate dehydrogenase